MCNLFASTLPQEKMLRLFPKAYDRLGNLVPLPEVYPDRMALILRNSEEGQELAMACWGLPTPPMFLKGKKTDRGITTVRNTKSPHWRRWLALEFRCIAPVASSRHCLKPWIGGMVS